MHHIPQRPHGPRHDGYLLHRLGILLKRADQGMPHLMIGHDPALLLAHDAILLFLAHQNHFHCVEQILLADIAPALLHGVDGSLIDHVRQIGSHCAAGSQSDGIQIHRLVHLHVLCMNLQDLHPALQVRLIHNDSSVEAPRTQQRLIQYLRSVRGPQNQDPLGAVEAVHLREQLVQRLLPLLIAPAVL